MAVPESLTFEQGDRRVSRRGSFVTLSAWLVLSICLFLAVQQNLAAPGMYYDEAVFGGLAKDFVVGQKRLHMPGCETVTIFSRRFPVFVQPYLGALKCWMLIPAFTVFGATLAVLRLTSVFWAMLAVLFFMLGIRRWLGVWPAIIGGLLLTLDPAWFFLGVLDWGAAVPALFCRCLAFYFGSVWWRNRNAGCLFLAGLFLGLGVFNKIDSLVFVAATGIAALCFYARDLWQAVRSRWWVTTAACFAFLLPILITLPRMGKVLVVAQQTPSLTNELKEKLHTLLALYDGSYFYRLINVGGLFNKMYDQPAAVYVPLWLVLAFAIVAAAFVRDKHCLRSVGFMLTSLILTTVGVLLLPGAIRIHHAILAFPFPQLIMVTALALLWNATSKRFARRAVRIAAVVSLILLGATQVYAIAKTERLIADTGGRGRWSNAVDMFCQENKDRSDLVIASLDWGFNEQVAFLADRPQLVEPFWAFPRYNGRLPALPQRPGYVYLAHSPEYSLFGYDVSYLNELQTSGQAVDIQAHSDRQGQVVFYTIQFRE
jgi:Dolichyl-phosphate-mannose-protein mannosyltransferase